MRSGMLMISSAVAVFGVGYATHSRTWMIIVGATFVFILCARKV